MQRIKQVHAFTLRNGIDHHSKSLVLELLQLQNLTYARKLFDFIPLPSVFLWNKLIQAYSSHGSHQICLSLYTQMCRRGCSPNQHTFMFLFAACPVLGSTSRGNVVHGQFVKSGFVSDVFALTALVDMYAKMGSLPLARRKFDEIEVKVTPTWNAVIAGYARGGDMEGALTLFESMPSRNVISWTAMISGYSQNGQYTNALAMFFRMEKERGVMPNAVTISSVLPACANLGALELGERIEAYARRSGYFSNMFVANGVLDMYVRCGNIAKAREVFDEIGDQRDVCSWNSMIMGFAVHGSCLEALDLFQGMLSENIAPDDVTLIGILLACSHGGMVSRGRDIFQAMESRFSVTPKLEHYGCMVDLLGRAGKLGEAYDLIQGMPMKPDSVIWGALLGACSFHGHVELAEKAAEQLFKLEPWNPGNYVILSNIYASARRWDGVARLRKLMKGGQITKAAGYSFIEEGGQIHKFIVSDKSHPKYDEIYSVLDEISMRMMKLSVRRHDFEPQNNKDFMTEDFLI